MDHNREFLILFSHLLGTSHVSAVLLVFFLLHIHLLQAAACEHLDSRNTPLGNVLCKLPAVGVQDRAVFKLTKNSQAF